MDKLLLVKLFSFLISSTVVLLSLAMEYRLSPFLTVYSFSSSSYISLVGIFNTWPIFRLVDTRLFSVDNSSTVVPSLRAMLYSVSPFCTV